MKNGFALFVFTGFLAFGSSAFAVTPLFHAGHDVGNGGDAIVCPGSKVILLDTYLATYKYGLHPSARGGDSVTILNNFLDRLALVNPTRAERYRKWAAEFSSEAEYLGGIKLVDIPDTGAEAIPGGCTLAQIAVQRTFAQRLPGDKRYTVDRDLWYLMDPFNQATLILHELIYRELLEGEMNYGPPARSSYVRYFNAHLMSLEFTDLEYQDLVMWSRLPDLDLIGYSRPSSDISYYEDPSQRKQTWYFHSVAPAAGSSPLKMGKDAGFHFGVFGIPALAHWGCMAGTFAQIEGKPWAMEMDTCTGSSHIVLELADKTVSLQIERYLKVKVDDVGVMSDLRTGLSPSEPLPDFCAMRDFVIYKASDELKSQGFTHMISCTKKWNTFVGVKSIQFTN